MTRLAGQRLLAELPTIPVRDAMLEELAERVLTDQRRANEAVGQYVGQEVDGQQLLMQVRPGGLMMPWNAEDAVREGVRLVPQQVEALMDEPPSRISEVVFGWTDAGRNPDTPVRLQYKERGKDAPTQAGLANELRRSLALLMERAGLEPGDLLVNSPYGIQSGDVRRAMAYMKQGYGPATVMADQAARLNRDGSLSPAMITSVHPALAERMGWVPG